MAIDILKEVNRIPRARLTYLDGDVAQGTFPISDTSQFEPGKEIEIKLRYEGESDRERTVFKGLITQHRVEMDARGSLLTLDLQDAAFKLTHPRKSAVYVDWTDSRIMRELIKARGLRPGRLAATQPQHAEIVQYHCSDWDFLLIRAEVNGLVVGVDDGEISVQPRVKTLQRCRRQAYYRRYTACKSVSWSRSSRTRTNCFASK